MKTGKRGPSLFDVMSKAPIGETVRDRPRPSWFRRKVAAPVFSVAEALTEEQAAAALADEQIVPEPEAAPPPTLQIPAEPPLPDDAEDAPSAPIFAMSQGRVILTLNTVACITLAGVITALALSAYVIGRQSSAGRIPPVAARTNDSELSTSPLLPAPSSAHNKSSKPKAAITNPDLSHLLSRPTESSSANANRPAKVADEAAEANSSADSPENLNYLQIESFRITRDRSGEQLAQDVAAVRQYLVERGVRTFARKRGNGFVLFAEQGFPAGKARAKDRAAFQRKIEQWGQEYRSAGGHYQFKGCLFVNFASTRAGDPV